MKIITWENFYDYIRLQIGAPYVNLEMTDLMLQQIIEDCIQLYCRYAYEEGSYLDYAVISLPANRDEVPISEIYDIRRKEYLSNVLDVVDFNLTFGYDGLNTLFSPSHVLLMELSNNRPFPSMYGNTTGPFNTGLVLSDYQISLQNLKIIQEKFGKNFTLNYLPASEVLKITPTPLTEIIGTIYYYKMEEMEKLFNQPLIKNLVMGKVRMQWAMMLSKYSFTLPENSTINGQFIYQEGKELYNETLELIKKESAPIDPILG